MKSCELHIAPSSDYYVYSPSLTAMNTFFYPICTGHFIYESGYHQHRNSFDSFLLMYLQSGELTVNFMDCTEVAVANDFVLLDCYQPHGYQTSAGCECIWCHFDGPMARAYYELILSHLGNVFTMHDPYPVYNKLLQIYQTFVPNQPIKEPLLSKQLTDILTLLLTYTQLHKNVSNNSNVIEDTVSYITEHFADELTVHELASRAMLSPYHFIRIFKKETGFTPHEYLINTRISTAKYLLKTTRYSIKDICFHTGFSCESVFCTSFKKNVGVTPAEYRNKPANVLS